MLLGRAAGDAVDRFGRVPVALAGVAVCAVLVAAARVRADARSRSARCGSRPGSAPRCCGPGINVLAVEAVPGNRAGGTSVVSAFKFAGNAAAPLMWLPLYHADPRLGFLGAGRARRGRPASSSLPLRVAR